MNNLEGLRDYDAVNGFADYHVQAFGYVRDFVISRYKSLVFNGSMIDVRNLNGSLGGYDLSRILNLHVLREASAHYAFSRICEKQYVEPGSVFDIRQKESKNLVKAYLSSVELTFDTDHDRVEDKSRSLRTWKISR
jgi:hypothetical protein